MATPWLIEILVFAMQAGQATSDQASGIWTSIGAGVAGGAATLLAALGIDRFRNGRHGSKAEEVDLSQDLRELESLYTTLRITLPQSALKPAIEIHKLIELASRDPGKVTKKGWERAEEHFLSTLREHVDPKKDPHVATYGAFLATANRIISFYLRKGKDST